MTTLTIPPAAVLDQSLENALYDVVDELGESDDNLQLLRDLANSSDVAEGLLELVGLPSDDYVRVADERASAMGRVRFDLAMNWLSDQLKRRGVDFAR